MLNSIFEVNQISVLQDEEAHSKTSDDVHTNAQENGDESKNYQEGGKNNENNQNNINTILRRTSKYSNSVLTINER